VEAAAGVETRVVAGVETLAAAGLETRVVAGVETLAAAEVVAPPLEREPHGVTLLY